ncbi:MAG: universal stress protein [Desulfobacteraceae bacterium]|jgi:nucleotide-binding universal stress UspA family protein
MSKQGNKKILLAVDGSDHALEAVRYVSKIPSLRHMGVVLFNVYSKVPESYWDIERQASPAWRMKEVRAWEREHKKTIQDHMERAKKILWRAGFPKDLVKVKIHGREIGIARDIVREAEGGYSCVVVGRKGMSKLKDLVLGSVSTKLLEKLDFVPLVTVGKNPLPGKVLLGFDGSEGSLRALDYLGSIFGDSTFEVALAYVIRGDKKEYTEAAKKQIAKAFEKGKSRLMKSGVESVQVTTKIITGAHSRASAITREAREGGYGTIVVGRRGLSKVLDFSMGRVSNKVIHMAKKQAVWVVT